MSELDGLTERIAEVLGAHQEQANDDGVIQCQCALDVRFDLPRSMATHQAEQVRAVLGEQWDAELERLIEVASNAAATTVAEHFQDRVARALAWIADTGATGMGDLRAILTGTEAP